MDNKEETVSKLKARIKQLEKELETLKRFMGVE